MVTVMSAAVQIRCRENSGGDVGRAGEEDHSNAGGLGMPISHSSLRSEVEDSASILARDFGSILFARDGSRWGMSRRDRRRHSTLSAIACFEGRFRDERRKPFAVCSFDRLRNRL